MYYNFGDKNYLSYGRFIEPAGKHVFNVLTCDEVNGKYKVCDCYIDTKDKMIDADDVYCYINLDEYSPLDFAVGCIDYYGPEAFSNFKNRWLMTKEEAVKFLNSKNIENLEDIK